ncbi:MAG: hypothetical protein V4736_00555 [Bdellovibrionota bacterium]
MYFKTLVVVGITLVSTALSASDSYDYNFPGCNGGGGNWPSARLQILQDLCANQNGENEVAYGGHCNGRLTLSVYCKSAQIKSVEIKDCFCD